FPEICDNQDNDLDGRIDEGGLQRACNSLCGGGAETCQAGRWFGCTAPMPQSEVCDNRDNDCDGRVDENVTRDCMNGCGNGSETCRLGVWGNCTAPQVGAEICDNQDNDCDGSIDENLFRACNRECSMGNQTCQQGGWSICDAASPAQEICNDGLDNDCDGTTDENCECRAGESESCSTNIGICVRGRTECRDNGRWGPCLDPGGAETTLPGEIDELCNGLDDNCNGVVDDIVPGPCGGSDIGACQRGTQTCANGVLACQGEVRPSIEVCDAQDNDCDGATDEDLMVDFYETNETCSRGEVLGPIPQNTEAPLNITATIYPDGDTDWYNLLIQEGRNFCIPNYLEIDQDYEATIQLSNIPADVDLELCVAVAAESRLISEACRGRVLVEEQCRGAEDGEDSITFTFVRRAFCQIDDSVRLLMRVRAPEDGPTFSCEPYTLSVTSRNL
ncbi:MAG: MopE-related protein, partial [Myxococcota bacterium]|nr:MopE-related protein [Myxococcota bacterium]